MSIADFHFSVSDIIGIIGVLMVLWAYVCIQINKLTRDDISFSLINLVGSIFIIVSLCHTMNLASFVIEIAWLIISAYGIIRCLRHKKNIIH
ncbi:MAG: hypothetical protein P1U63_06240 [Coxiellaceae bacterium]|nr:hypothetical protein [Coxiellaceae bacterium]